MGGVTYGLADQGDLLSVHYPAISYDGGRTWAIDGPIFYIAAADGTAAVNTIAAVSATTAYAWGSGNFIRWTTNGGRQWWGAFLPGGVDRVAIGNGTVAVTIHADGTNEPSYLLGDDSRSWKLRL